MGVGADSRTGGSELPADPPEVGTNPLRPLGKLIGYVAWGSTCCVELWSGDAWRVTIGGRECPDLGRAMAAIYEDRFRGPAYGQPGYAALLDWAEKTGGVAVLPPVPPHDPDVKY